MRKAELVSNISKETGVEKNVVTAVLESAMDNVKKSIAEGEPVFLRGFGTFLKKLRKAKPGRNITAKTTVIIPERFVPYFKPCKSFKEML